MADLYMVNCEKCGFQVPVVLEQLPTEETTTICEHCKALESW
jgi:predicted nucleic acid-binding Zn ribbon protein